MLDIGSLQFQAENPNLITVLYTILCAFSLGLIIVFTYNSTTHATQRYNHFMQALVLATIVAATVIQAIGDSVARGLGMLGALSIIRFRTTLRNPRNIVFMFGSLAAGIACGVFGFTIAIVGTLAFCASAFALRATIPMQEGNLIGKLDIVVHDSCPNPHRVEEIIQKWTEGKRIDRFSSKPPTTVRKKTEKTDQIEGDTSSEEPEYTLVEVPGSKTYRYAFKVKNEQIIENLQADLTKTEGVDLKDLTCRSVLTDIL